METLLSHLHVFLSRIASFFSHEKILHQARFARVHELSDMLTPTLPTDSLLLGISNFSRILHVRATKTRRELGNLLVVAPTRGGKGLLAVSQLLTWKHSVIVSDIKGELFDQTAGYRKTIGKVYVIDPNGIGHRYDPLLTKKTEKDFLSAATHLLHRPDEGEGRIFTERATVMLTQLFLAGREEHIPLFPYVRQIVRRGLVGAVKKLCKVSPDLATQFLDMELGEANFDDRFLVSSWGTLSTRMRFLLTDSVVRSLTGADFTAEEIMHGSEPVTLYLRLPEQDILSLNPLVRLLWESLIGELITTFDSAKGQNCRPVLLLIDEAANSPIPNLHQYATTVVGRGMSLWVAIQALSQLDAVYGKHKADTIKNNMDSSVYYRQSSQKTAEYIERALGKQSGFAHSQSSHEGDQTSQGLSEQAVSLMTAQGIRQLGHEETLIFHSNLPPIQAKRMDWRYFPILTKRRAIPPPQLSALPVLSEQFPDRGGQQGLPVSSWQPDPSLFLRGNPTPSTNGFRKKRS